MKSKQNPQASSLSSGKSEQLTVVDTGDDFDELKNRGLNLRPLWRTIKRNVLLITGITTAVAVTALYTGLTSPRSYEGDFRLLVEPITSEARLTDPSVLSRDGASTSVGMDYPSLLQILQSPGLLSGIAKRIQTRYPDVSYESLKEDLLVERIGTNSLDSTKLIEVRYKGEDPEKVQFVLAELAKGYLSYSLENRKARIGGGVQFIEDQLPRLQQRVNGLEGKLQAFQQRYKLIDPATDSEGLSEQVRVIETRKLETQRELQEQKRLYVSLQKQLGLSPNQALAASALSEDPRYQELLGQLKKTESQIAVGSARFKEGSPPLQSLREQQQKLSLLLNQEAQRILGQNLPNTARNSQVLNFQNATRLELIKQLVNSANQVQVLEVRNQELAKAQALVEQQVQQFAATVGQYNALMGRLEVATKTLNQLLVQREILQVEAAQKQVPWEVVSEPTIPRDAAGNPIPVPRDNAKNLAIQLHAGFLLGLGVAVLREKYRNVFYTTEDIRDTIDLPILGVISCNRRAKHSISSAGVATKESKVRSDASLVLETFYSLYANIRFLGSDSPVRSLVVTSAAPGDGKTTIALHLAQAAAAMGQQVLLVDANLRLPQLHTRLDLPNERGLSDLLSKNLNPNELIQGSPLQENLFVLTSGQLLQDPTSLLASTKMQHLVEQFQTAFDLVIYDTSHLLGIVDANFLAEHTDGILMVVGLSKTKLSEITEVVNELNTFRLPILGIVANYVQESTNRNNNRYHEQSRRVPTYTKKSKIFEADLLTSVQQTDDPLR